MAFTFFGQVSVKMPSTNLIWAFTPGGKLDNRGWLSEKTGGGDMGIFKMVKDGVDVHKRMLVAVPFVKPGSPRTPDFASLLNKGSKADILRIRLFDPDPNINRFTINILLKDVKVAAVTRVKFSHELRASFDQFCLHVQNVDFEGA